MACGRAVKSNATDAAVRLSMYRIGHSEKCIQSGAATVNAAPVFFELRSCDYCHSAYLWAAWKNEDGRWLIRQSVSGDDDFSTGKEPEESESIPAIQAMDKGWQPILIHNEGEAAQWMDFVDADNPGHYGRACLLGADRMEPRQPLVCRSCGREHRHNRPVFQSLRLSAPVLQEALLPVLLRHAAPMQSVAEVQNSRPCAGRRLLSFTDSRQGTARFALKCQQDSEQRWLQSQVVQKVVAVSRGIDPNRAQQVLYDIEHLRDRLKSVDPQFRPMLQGGIKAHEKSINGS